MKIKNLLLIQSLIIASFTSTFAQINTISADILPAEGGIVNGAGNYFTGSPVNLEAIPNLGYDFEYWTEDGFKISEDSLLSFIAFGNRQLTANFKLKSYIIGGTPLPLEGGNINGGGTYLHNSNVILEANKNIGYSFINWTEENVEISTDSVLIFPALKSQNYVANFILNNYLVSASASPLGTGIIEGTGNFNHGDSVFLKAVPTIGYRFEFWSENGFEISNDSVFSFVAETNRNLTAHFSLNSYFINATASPIIGGTVGGTGNFNHGVLAQLVATPASGYVFSNWTEGDSVVSADSNYLFIVDKNRNLIANFAEKQFLVTTEVNPEFSGITSGDSNYTNLSLVTVSATPNIGWVFNNWSENDKILAVDSAYSFIVLENRNLTANFSKKIYELNLISFPTEGGDVEGFGAYPHDSLVTITAIPSPGWHFLNWTENDTIVSSDSLLAFNIANERNLTANYEKDVYQVTTMVYPESSGNTIGDSLYTFGDSVYLIAVPNSNSGWEFVNWTKGEEIISQDSVLTFLSNDNVNLMANFKLKDYSVNLVPFPENAGVVQGLGTYTHGDSVTVSAEPEAGWFFANWTDGVSNVSSEPILKFAIDNDKILIANFAHELYSVNSTPQPAEAGYVSGSGTFYYNQSTTLIPVANPGWEFVNWTENDNEISSDSLLNLNITENMIIKANFKQINYSINCIANPVEGGITLGCGISRYNKEMELTATANEGWEFVNWTENGEIVSIMLDYTFNVTDHRNIVANFQLATSVNSLENEKVIPEEYYLSNAYPNPFNPATTINFGLPEASNVKIIVSDINGQIVKTILGDEFLSAGNYSTNFEASDLSSGIYLYIILAKGENSQNIFKKVQKLILLK